MAERCKCGQPAHGQIGMIVMCRACMAELTGLPAKEFRKPRPIQLYHEGADVGIVQWVPWSFMQKRGA